MESEKSHRMFLAVLFGILGTVLLLLAWLVPADTSDRIIAAAVGSVGLVAAVIHLPVRHPEDKTVSERVESEEKP